MTVAECYQYVQNRLNKSQSNFSDNIEKYQFVEAFNTAQLLWTESRFKVDETSIARIDEIQHLITTVNLKPKKTGSNYYEVAFPENYLHYKRSVSFVPCEIKNHLKKEGDINVLLAHEFWRPSVEWEETICTIAGDKLRIYVTDFSIKSVELHYYRVPRKINMNDGFNDINANQTENIDPEFKNSSLLEILNFTCQILASDSTDQWNYQTLLNLNQSHT